MNRLTGYLLLATCLLLLAACSPSDAASQVNAPAFQVTAELDQYRRDARATEDARDAKIDALAVEMAATARAVAEQERLIAAQNAQAALDATATITARIQADAHATEAANVKATQTREGELTATAVLEVKATEARKADLTTTAIAEGKATGTQIVIGTQTALMLQAEQDDLNRSKVFTSLGWLMVFVTAAVALGLFIELARGLMRILKRRSMAHTYGLHNNLYLLIEDEQGGYHTVDPLSDTSSGTTLTPAGKLLTNPLGEQARLATLLAKTTVLKEQAQHSPFPPVLQELPPPPPTYRPSAPPPEWGDILPGEFVEVEPRTVTPWLDEVKARLLEGDSHATLPR